MAAHADAAARPLSLPATRPAAMLSECKQRHGRAARHRAVTTSLLCLYMYVHVAAGVGLGMSLLPLLLRVRAARGDGRLPIEGARAAVRHRRGGGGAAVDHHRRHSVLWPASCTAPRTLMNDQQVPGRVLRGLSCLSWRWSEQAAAAASGRAPKANDDRCRANRLRARTARRRRAAQKTHTLSPNVLLRFEHLC